MPSNQIYRKFNRQAIASGLSGKQMQCWQLLYELLETKQKQDVELNTAMLLSMLDVSRSQFFRIRQELEQKGFLQVRITINKRMYYTLLLEGELVKFPSGGVVEKSACSRTICTPRGANFPTALPDKNFPAFSDDGKVAIAADTMFHGLGSRLALNKISSASEREEGAALPDKNFPVFSGDGKVAVMSFRPERSEVEKSFTPRANDRLSFRPERSEVEKSFTPRANDRLSFRPERSEVEKSFTPRANDRLSFRPERSEVEKSFTPRANDRLSFRPERSEVEKSFTPRANDRLSFRPERSEVEKSFTPRANDRLSFRPERSEVEKSFTPRANDRLSFRPERSEVEKSFTPRANDRLSFRPERSGVEKSLVLHANDKEIHPSGDLMMTNRYDQLLRNFTAAYENNLELWGALRNWAELRKNNGWTLTGWGLDVLLQKLAELGKGCAATMAAIVRRSVEKRWKGFYPLRVDSKPSGERLRKQERREEWLEAVRKKTQQVTHKFKGENRDLSMLVQ